MKGKGQNSERKRTLKWSIARAGMVVLLVSIAIAVTVLTVTPVMAQEAEVTTVTVNAPTGYVGEGETFDVTIDVEDITDFNGGWFDLHFDSSVVKTKVKDVTDGSIDDTEIPITMCDFLDSEDTIKVMFELSGVTIVSGSGYLAKITFEVKGKEGDESALEISDGELMKYVFEDDRATPEAIEANWNSAVVKVGVEEEEEEEEEEEVDEEVIPGSPNITAWKPVEAVVSNAVGESRTFNITVDLIADISWQINGTEVQTNETVTEASFTKGAVIGTWNISAIATNTTTGLSDMHTWIWSVTLTPTATVTPTPTLAPGETPAPTPTLAPGETPKPTATPTTDGKPTPTPTPKPAVPGFEAIFAIVGMLSIAYILQRRR